MSTPILTIKHNIRRITWRLRIFSLFLHPQRWKQLSGFLELGLQGSGALHDISNTVTILRFLHSDVAPQLTNRQNGELAQNFEYLHLQIQQAMQLLDNKKLPKIYFDVGEQMEECLHLFQKHHQAYECHISIQSPVEALLFGPPMVFLQSLNNILLNSAQAMLGQKTKAISLTLEKYKKGVRVIIKDTGPGFPPKFHLRLLASGKNHGRGLGLWHSIRQLEEFFFCNVTLENREDGKGAQTTIYFWLAQ